MENSNGHNWEDISYHGSFLYECYNCGIMDYDKKAQEPCPNPNKRDQMKSSEDRTGLTTQTEK